ncbi:MAG: chemotaxis protein CheW [Gemmatimonadaceae bacterium]
MIQSPRGEYEFVTFRVGMQWFGVPVMTVQEVLVVQRLARIPLAPPEVTGVLNLRGQLVTAINLHKLLDAGTRPEAAAMNVVVRDGDELFAMVVDEVGEVITVAARSIEPLPATLDTCWRAACEGVVRSPHGLLAVLEPGRLLDDSLNCHSTAIKPRSAV